MDEGGWGVGVVVLAWRSLSKRKSQDGDQLGEEDEEISLVEIAENFYECLDVICKDYSEGFQVDNDYGDNIPGYYEIKDWI